MGGGVIGVRVAPGLRCTHEPLDRHRLRRGKFCFGGNRQRHADRGRHRHRKDFQHGNASLLEAHAVAQCFDLFRADARHGVELLELRSGRARMISAVFGPMPGRASRSNGLAVLRFTLCGAGGCQQASGFAASVFRRVFRGDRCAATSPTAPAALARPLLEPAELLRAALAARGVGNRRPRYSRASPAWTSAASAASRRASTIAQKRSARLAPGAPGGA